MNMLMGLWVICTTSIWLLQSKMRPVQNCTDLLFCLCFVFVCSLSGALTRSPLILRVVSAELIIPPNL